MSLTGIPLMSLAALCTLAAVAGTVMVWNRNGRLRYVWRVTGVLFAEVLLLTTFALAVNRSQEFYPSWAALPGMGGRQQTIFKTDESPYGGPRGGLDGQLAILAGGRPGASLAFPWRSADWRSWGFAAPPTVITPPGYLSHRTWSYSVVVVLSDPATRWTAVNEADAARRATATGISAIVVLATVTAAVTAHTLDAALPDRLNRDFRVSAHHWAIVTAAGDADLAQSAVAAAPLRYPSVSVASPVADGGAAGKNGRCWPAGTTGRTPVLPAGVLCAAVETDNANAQQEPGVVPLRSTASDVLYTGLSWAIERTPAPLAPPVEGAAPARRGRSDSPASGGHDDNRSPVSRRGG